ncbi:4-phosphopantetheinyl transferase [Lapidilactobacillus concavus DSM 17758]|uniref:Holo-[acyl-carrier-protein] synthase n=1 Tax=Lapidilactobacillus concavus DSM 17758 TaxID=1423735 RepID=A0A0R1VZZ4_9LACO|nr:holo-ACP synthase [Lapidilactobacillus concavus]KRM08659.1 4-phosphopantetheinyl transferase [Lapidilactobacillus concavus DSM 17758]GEL13120.1 holo-[acyl-carrier-protein] synthase [Lapidilactobacillus concavus]
MIYGNGVDLTDIPRIKQAYLRNARFANKVLTDHELEIFDHMTNEKFQMEFLAGRFSAKESYSKAYGTGLGKIGLHDIEILDDALGKPIVTKQPYAGNAFVSISHTDALVMTEVILEISEKSQK